MLRFLCRLTATVWAAWLGWHFFGALLREADERGDSPRIVFTMPRPITVRLGKFTITRGV